MLILFMVFLLVLVPATTFAEDFVVLHADFTADDAGTGPSGDLFGDPLGDTLWLYNHTEPSSAIVHSSFWELTDKPLVVSRLSGSHIQVYFSFDPEHINCNSYTVTFDAMAGNPLGYAYFTFREEGLRNFISLGFADDPRLDISGQGPITLHNSAQETSVRWYEADALSFEYQIDLVDGSYDLSIDGTPVPEAQGHPFSVANHDGTFAHMGLQFGGTGDAVMAIDNLHVVAHCGPGVEVEGTSWGSVKSMWSGLEDSAPQED